jgi:hypothetical protein
VFDDVLAERGEFLKRPDIETGPMQSRDKNTVFASLNGRGLKLEFDEDKLGPL